MIDVKNLCLAYPSPLPGHPDVMALDGVSFHIAPGEVVAVMGGNSSGKSTLCLALAGLAPRLTSGGRITGTVHIAGQDVQALPPGALARTVGVVFQDPTGQLFNTTVEAEVAWGLENLGLPVPEMEERIRWALDAVGLDAPRDQPPEHLSGGQQKRLALAAALALRPTVLLIDSLTGGLDPQGRREVIEALRGLCGRDGYTVLFTENDAEVVAALAGRVLALHEGRLVMDGPPAEVFREVERLAEIGIAAPPAAQLAHHLRRAGRPADFCTLEGAVAAFTPSPANAAFTPIQSLPRCTGEGGRRPGGGASPAIEFEHVTFGYRADAPVLREISFAIPAGQFAALTGANGAGKTTLARCLIGLLHPTGGAVHVMGHNTADHATGELARWVGFAFQNPEMQIFNPTVREELAFGPRNVGMEGADLEQAMTRAMADFDLGAWAEHPPAALSFSLRRMVALASIAAMMTPLLVVDEPTVGLDANGAARLAAWLTARHAAGATVLLITHDMELAARLAERVLILHGGCLIADSSPAEVFRRSDLLAEAGLAPPFAVRLAERLGAPELGRCADPAALAAALAPHLKEAP